MRHLRLYRAVDAIARHQSIRAAAYGLAISPSALNRQVLGLERELGVELFERLTRGVRLSTAGEVYLNAFRSHLAELERASAQISDLSGLRSGTVRLGVGPELAAGEISDVATRYRSDFPDLDLEIAVIPCNRVSQALQSFDIDVYVGVNPIIDDAVEVLHSQEAQVACAGKSAPGGGRAIRLSQLVEAPLVVNSEASGLRLALDASFTAKSTPIRYALVTDQLGAGHLPALDDALALTVSEFGGQGGRQGAWEDRGRERSSNIAVIDARDLAPVFIKVLRLTSRSLPIGSARLAERLIDRLSRAEA